MHNINIITVLLVKFLHKSYNASRKFHFPLILVKFFYEIYFISLKILLLPYLNKAYAETDRSNPTGYSNTSKVIWVFWWQGYNQMPLIVNKCIHSVINHANGHQVILLTKTNLSKYTSIPKFIYEKVRNGQISFTHFSDIIRFNVLNKYGGLWCDATMYCTSKINNEYFNYLYTSGGYKDTDPKFVHGKWAGFLIGGNKYNPLFQFMNNYFKIYWENNKYQIAYFLIDLGLRYAYDHNIGDFKYYVNNDACRHNPNLFKLIDWLDQPYNDVEYKKLINDTNMFKLTYKQKFNIKNNSFYYCMIHDKL